MKTIEFPEAVKPALLKRLVILGAVVCLSGIALLLTEPQWMREILTDRQGPLVLSVGLIVVGVAFFTIGVAGLLLQASWKPLSLTIEFGGSLVPNGSPLRRGDTLQMRLEVKALKDVRITAARSKLVVEEKPTAASTHSRRIYENEVEDPSVKDRSLQSNQIFSCSFEQTLPVNMEPSSDRHFWYLLVEVESTGAPEFLQKKSLMVE